MPTRIRAIFYDAGFTLIRPVYSIAEVCVQALERRGHTIEAKEFAAAMPAFEPFLDARQHDGDYVFADDERVTELWHTYYRDAFAQTHGHTLSEAELRELADEVTTLFGRPDHWQPFPEVPATLQEGRQRGLVQGVISDWGAGLNTILHGLDLTRDLDFVVVSAVMGAAKPELHLFDLALARGGLQPGEVIYVGDTYRSDVLGGRGAGIFSVLLDRQKSVGAADCPVIDRLDSIFEIVDALDERTW